MAADSEEPQKQNQCEVEHQPELVPVSSSPQDDDVVSSQHHHQGEQDDESTEETPPPPKQLTHRQTSTAPSKTSIYNTEAVKPLTDPKLIKGRRRIESPSDGPATIYITPTKQKSPSSSPITPETHKITICTISSTPSSINSANINESSTTTRKVYNNNRQHKQTTRRKTSRGALHDLLEDVQFCGMYFCGEFLDRNNNDDAPDDVPKDKECSSVNTTAAQVVNISKEERMREMDETFLGKLIQCECGDVGDSCGTSGDDTLFRSDEESDE